MTLTEMRQSLQEAKNTLNTADTVSTDMAQMLVGRLHKVWDNRALAKLKRELQDYNAHTGKWKEGK